MNLLHRIFAHRFGSKSSNGGPLPLACYLAGVAILVLGMRKLTTLALTEAELFFGILLVLVAGMCMVSIGLLTHLVIVAAKQGREAEGH